MVDLPEPLQVTGAAHWHVLLRARAIENGAYVLAPAQSGHHENGRRTYGHSLIVYPWGGIIAEADGADAFITAQLDMAAVARARQALPVFEHGRSFSLSATAERAPLMFNPFTDNKADALRYTGVDDRTFRSYANRHCL